MRAPFSGPISWDHVTTPKVLSLAILFFRVCGGGCWRWGQGGALNNLLGRPLGHFIFSLIWV